MPLEVIYRSSQQCDVYRVLDCSVIAYLLERLEAKLHLDPTSGRTFWVVVTVS